MRVQHNIPAMNAYRNYNNNSSGINKNLEKLSSGYKINRAGDDAAGLAISEKMRAQITGLEVAQKNAKDGISLVQTAEGALTEVQDMLNRMYKLAEQSANGTYSNDVDRAQLDKEVEKLRDEIDRIASTANFNGTKLLDGSLAASGSNGTTQTDGTTQTEETTGGTGSATVTAGVNFGGDFGTAGLTQDKIDATNATADVTINVLVNSSDATENPGMIVFMKPDSTDTYSVTDSDGNALTNVTSASGTVTVNLGDNGSIKVNVSSLTGSAGAYTGDVINVTYTANSGTNNNGGASDPLTYDENGQVDTAMETGKKTTTWSGEKGLYLWIGAEVDKENALKVEIESVKSDDLKIGEANVDITTQAGALNSLVYIEDAINKVSDIRGTLGATQNRLEHTINNLSVMQENMQDAESTIRDTDVAEEMMKYTKNSILVQSAQAMLAQANQLPQGVLQLLQ